MKNVFIILSIIATILISCTENENKTSDSNAIEKTSINFSVSSPSKTSKTTGKDVQRGEITAFVKDINISATNNSYVSSETFHLVNSWDGQEIYNNTDSAFKLDNVGVGFNNFKIVTTSTAIPWYGFAQYVIGTNLNDEELKIYFDDNVKLNNGQIPYVIYTGEILNKIISKDNPELNKLNFNLTTNIGRILSTFTLDKELIDGAYGVHIIVKHYSSINSTVSIYPDYGIYFTRSRNFMIHRWNNEIALAGGVLYFTIEIRPNIQDKTSIPLYSYTFKGDVIEASTSKLSQYIISKDKITKTVEGSDNIQIEVQNN